MANYKMILQYDGTRYRGWQVLPSELTIQGKLQDVLSKMAGYQVEVTGSGRTDAGVHAKGQTANFHLKEEWDEEKILSYLNQYLPEDIAVCEVKRVQPCRISAIFLRGATRSFSLFYILHWCREMVQPKAL